MIFENTIEIIVIASMKTQSSNCCCSLFMVARGGFVRYIVHWKMKLSTCSGMAKILALSM
jgi:hypothetical protein